MKERSERLKVIQQIIKDKRVGSQEMLLEHLKKQGFTVTQATLSRDLKSLRVGKVSDETGGYYYILPTEEQLRETQHNYASDIKRGFLSIDFSANIAVVRTIMGHADTIAIALDNLGIDSVMGTVAGEDTVVVVLREDTSRELLLTELRRMVPSLEV